MKRKLSDFGELSPAEAKIRDEICLGQTVVIGDGERPEADAGPNRQVRAEFLRYLILGGCDGLDGPIPENGVNIQGARVTGLLDLEGARVPREIGLFDCHFDTAPLLRSAQIDSLFLNDSRLPGLNADGLLASGDVVLRNAKTSGAIRLLGAKLGGDLDCDDAELGAGAEGVALYADGFSASGGVYLRKATSSGTIRLVGAMLEGDLACDGAELGAGAEEVALFADRFLASGTFDLRDGAKLYGLLSLSSAGFGAINDDEGCWPAAGNLILDRCRYGAFTGRSPVTAEARIRWLELQESFKLGSDFRPQPWEQCAKVLREMGHGEAARKILIRKEWHQRRERQERLRLKNDHVQLWLTCAGDTLLNIFVRYGHRPMLAFLWLLGFWVLGYAIFDTAAQNDSIKPNNAFVLRSAEWAACHEAYIPPTEATAHETRWDPERHSSQLDCFYAQPEAASYPQFNALIYSADTLLPIVAMEMQEFWIPDEGASTLGAVARVFLWIQIAMGWALSLLAVAGFSGLVKTDGS